MSGDRNTKNNDPKLSQPHPAGADLLRGVVAAEHAAKAAAAAQVLFAAGGQDVLSEAGRQLLRRQVGGLAEVAAGELTPKLLSSGLRAPTGLSSGVSSTSTAAAGAAAGQVLGAAARSSGFGAAFDGIFATAEAIRACDRGEMTADQGVEHVVKETVSGGLACGAGTLAVVGLAMLTGPVTWGPALLVGGATSFAAKSGLRSLFR